MCGVFAEFERAMIGERINAGLARARANGTKLGRRPVKPAVEVRIRQLRAKGDGILKIGRTLGIGTSVVQRVVGAEAGWGLQGRQLLSAIERQQRSVDRQTKENFSASYARRTRK
jgi:DNA invertase Pin-like site-specific DNA recombinase